jgi:MYND finger protein
MGILAQSNDSLRRANQILEQELRRRNQDIAYVVQAYDTIRHRVRRAEDEVLRLTRPFVDATNRARNEVENLPPRFGVINESILEEAAQLTAQAEVFRCSRCKETLYSSRDEQVRDWPEHQLVCTEWKE